MEDFRHFVKTARALSVLGSSMQQMDDHFNADYCDGVNDQAFYNYHGLSAQWIRNSDVALVALSIGWDVNLYDHHHSPESQYHDINKAAQEANDWWRLDVIRELRSDRARAKALWHRMKGVGILIDTGLPTFEALNREERELAEILVDVLDVKPILLNVVVYRHGEVGAFVIPCGPQNVEFILDVSKRFNQRKQDALLLVCCANRFDDGSVFHRLPLEVMGMIARYGSQIRWLR
jgi:hypothetical protein